MEKKKNDGITKILFRYIGAFGEVEEDEKRNKKSNDVQWHIVTNLCEKVVEEIDPIVLDLFGFFDNSFF